MNQSVPLFSVQRPVEYFAVQWVGLVRWKYILLQGLSSLPIGP